MMCKSRVLSIVLIFITIFLIISPSVWSSQILDAQYRLEKIAILRVWDQVDGLFEEPMALAFTDYFNKKTRFLQCDLTNSEQILKNTKIPYDQLIKDKKILKKITRVTGADSLIRTKILKQQERYHFTLDWLHSENLDFLGSLRWTWDSSHVQQPLGQDLVKKVHESLDQLFLKVPFLGHVTGRSGDEVTVNLGTQAGVQPGDELIIETLKTVKVHPLLNEIVRWEMIPVGVLKVKSAEEDLSFCSVVEEEASQNIQKLNKITQIKKNNSSNILNQDYSFGKELDNRLPADTRFSKEDEISSLGYWGLSIKSGLFSRSFDLGDASLSVDGSAIQSGFQGLGELWWTHAWFSQVMIHYAWVQGSDTINANNQNSRLLGDLNSLDLLLGYQWDSGVRALGSHMRFYLGYHSQAFHLTSRDVLRMPTTWALRSFFVGAGLYWPFLEPWILLGDLKFRVLSWVHASIDEWNQSHFLAGVTDWQTMLGIQYGLSTQVAIRLMFDIQVSGLGAIDKTYIYQKSMTLSPQFLYYF